MKEFGQFINEHPVFIFACWSLAVLAIICGAEVATAIWGNK